MLRKLTVAAGLGLLALAVGAWSLPLPTATPAVPVPSPSIPTLLGTSSPAPTTNSTNQPSGQVAGTGTAARSASPGASGRPQLALPAGPAADPAQPAAGGIGSAASGSAAARSAAGLPATGGAGPPGDPGFPNPLEPALLLAAVAALGVVLARVHRPALGAAPYRLRIRVIATVPGPRDAVVAAARSLLQSGLPPGCELSEDADGGLTVEAAPLARALLSSALPEIAARGRRVGLRLDWSVVEPETPRPAPARARLAVS